MELSDILDFLHASARSVGAEVTSPWFYLQLGLVLAGAGISFAVGAAIRSRIDLAKLGLSWPAAPRMMVHVLVSSASTAVFAVVMRITASPGCSIFGSSTSSTASLNGPR